MPLTSLDFAGCCRVIFPYLRSCTMLAGMAPWHPAAIDVGVMLLPVNGIRRHIVVLLLTALMST
jgi:hypothetical protein